MDLSESTQSLQKNKKEAQQGCTIIAPHFEMLASLTPTKEELDEEGQINFVLDEEAGHFSYMDELPPQVADSQPDRTVFLADLAKDIAQFITPQC